MDSDNISIILLGTKHPGNIGSTARAMFNMGLSGLVLAAPRCSINEEAFRMAKSGKVILESATVCDSVQSALKDISFLAGTTSKSGGYRAVAHTPRSLVQRILDHARRQKVGILFGPEDTGLVDEHLQLCNLLLRIPTQRKRGSINLAQAVMIICYELFLGSLDREPSKTIRLAPMEQTEAMYAQLERALLDIGFLTPQNAGHMMIRLRNLFGRAGLQSSDVGILRGIARQIAWFGKSRK